MNNGAGDVQIRPIEALDPSVIIAVVFILAATAAVAAILPTLDAVRGDVLKALRYE
ncbi:MAG: hypothetical protein HY646_17280 [Acidobacteria bacterium]|nr:hypothetical protein [Acidobacteriota bacterium]